MKTISANPKHLLIVCQEKQLSLLQDSVHEARGREELLTVQETKSEGGQLTRTSYKQGKQKIVSMSKSRLREAVRSSCERLEERARELSLTWGVGKRNVSQTTKLKQRDDCFSHLKKKRVQVPGNFKESDNKIHEKSYEGEEPRLPYCIQLSSLQDSQNRHLHNTEENTQALSWCCKVYTSTGMEQP